MFTNPGCDAYGTQPPYVIGTETGSPVTKDYMTRKFSGDVNWVEIDVGRAAEDLDHLIKPEERLAIAMALQ